MLKSVKLKRTADWKQLITPVKTDTGNLRVEREVTNFSLQSQHQMGVVQAEFVVCCKKDGDGKTEQGEVKEVRAGNEWRSFLITPT